MPRDVDPTVKKGSNRLPPAKRASICSAIASGMTVKEASVFHEVSVNTVYGLLSDPDFRDMLQIAEDEAVNAILAEVTSNVRNAVKTLGPKALEALEQALDSEDGRVKLQAAGMVLRGTGIMDGGKEINIRVGVEGAVGGDSSSFGD